MQKLSFHRLHIATEVFRKDSRKDAWLASYQESNKLMQRINSNCSSSKTKSRSTKSNSKSKSTQVHSRLRKKNVYWATHKRSVNFSQGLKLWLNRVEIQVRIHIEYKLGILFLNLSSTVATSSRLHHPSNKRNIRVEMICNFSLQKCPSASEFERKR